MICANGLWSQENLFRHYAEILNNRSFFVTVLSPVAANIAFFPSMVYFPYTLQTVQNQIVLPIQ
jgi:hypothetical protein